MACIQAPDMIGAARAGHQHFCGFTLGGGHRPQDIIFKTQFQVQIFVASELGQTSVYHCQSSLKARPKCQCIQTILITLLYSSDIVT